MTTDGPHGRLPPDHDATILALEGAIDRADIAAFCERARAGSSGPTRTGRRLDLGVARPPDAVTVEALARLQLEARRLGRRLVFRDACGELRELVAFVGLDRALPCDR